MPIKGGGFSRKSQASSDVPDSSMADIAFLLLIFFMVTTVFQKDPLPNQSFTLFFLSLHRITQIKQPLVFADFKRLLSFLK